MIFRTAFIRNGHKFQMVQTFRDGSVKITDISKAEYLKGLEVQQTKKQMIKSAANGVAIAGGLAAGEAALAGGAAAAEAAGGLLATAEIIAAVPVIVTVAAVGGIGYGIWRGVKALSK